MLFPPRVWTFSNGFPTSTLFLLSGSLIPENMHSPAHSVNTPQWSHYYLRACLCTFPFSGLKILKSRNLAFSSVPPAVHYEAWPLWAFIYKNEGRNQGPSQSCCSCTQESMGTSCYQSDEVLLLNLMSLSVILIVI